MLVCYELEKANRDVLITEFFANRQLKITMKQSHGHYFGWFSYFSSWLILVFRKPVPNEIFVFRTALIILTEMQWHKQAFIYRLNDNNSHIHLPK